MGEAEQADKGRQDKSKLWRTPARKFVVGLVLLMALSWVYLSYLNDSSSVVGALDSLETRTIQMESLVQSLGKAFRLSDAVSDDIEKRHGQKVILEAAACAGRMEEGEDLKPGLHEDGAIVRVTGATVDDLKGLPLHIEPGVSDELDDSGTLDATDADGERCVVYYSRIAGDLYYIEWDTISMLDQSKRELFDLEKTIDGMEGALGVNILLLSAVPREDGSHEVLYASQKLKGDSAEAAPVDPFAEAEGESEPGTEPQDVVPSTAEDYGITKEMLSAYRVQRRASDTRALDDYHEVTVGGTSYELYLHDFDGSVLRRSTILACLFPLEGTRRIQKELTWIVVCFFFIIGVSVLVWFCATLRLVREHNLNDRQKRELSAKNITNKMFSTLAIGSAVLMLVSALLYSLSRLYATSARVDAAVSSMQQRIQENMSQSGLAESVRKKTYEEFAVRVAAVLESQRDDLSPEGLQEICDLIGADYIMLFDGEGNETLTNSSYVGLSLGTDPESPTFDYRALLTGAEQVTRDLTFEVPSTEEGEGSTRQDVVVGVRFGRPEEGENYGALLLAVPADQVYDSAAESIDDIMAALVSDGMFAFSVDPETHLVLHASAPDVVGRNALESGLPEAVLADGYRDFMTIEGIPCYIESAVLDDVIYCYATKQSSINDGIWSQAALSMVMAFFLLSGFAGYLLMGYREFYAVWVDTGRDLGEDEVKVSDGRWKYSKDPSERWKPAVSVAGIHAPFRLARLVAEVLLTIFILLLGTRLVPSEASDNVSLVSFVIYGKWTRGFNLFAFTSILILLGEMLVIMMLIKLFLHLMSRALGTKGETVCRLLINMTSYVCVIAFGYLALYYLGFDPSTLLASLGLASFAISLGAKDLITDIIAGLTIVAEGDYQVGDIIEVGGYRGEVLEVGVRSTKLEGRGGNIKIISNRDIKNVVNMTRKNSWYPLEVSVSSDHALDQVESMFEESLPRIGAAIPEILSGPFYRGVVSIGGGKLTLSIIAECSEENYFKVQRSLNRAIQELFEEHDIKIL